MTSGEARPGEPSVGSLRCRFAGWSRGPSPFGTVQTISPVFMSIAVIRPYGGLNNGNPCGPPIRARVPFTKRQFVFSGSPV